MILRTLLALCALFMLFSIRASGEESVPDSTRYPALLAALGVVPATPMQGADSVVTFVSALNRVVATNPLIGASRATINAAAGRLQQSRYRLNPSLSIDVEDLGRSHASGPSQTTLGIEQPLELWGKRTARRESAEAILLATQYDSERLFLDLYRQTAVAFSSLLGAQENLTNARKRLDLAIRIHEAVKIKVSDGAVPKSELLRAESSTKLAEVDVTQAQAALNQSRVALATLWGGTPVPQRAEGNLDWWDIELNFDSLLEYISDQPQVRSLEAQVASREAELRLARSLAKPDVTVGGGYRRLHDTNDDGLVAWVSLPLPLFDRNKGGVQEAASNIEGLRAELVSTKQSLTSELQQLVIALAAQRSEVAVIQNDVLPTAEAALEAIDEAYRLGSQPYLNVLDAQRNLADIQLRWIEAQVRGATIAAGIESITGRPINAVGR